MAKITDKLPPALQWPAANIDRTPELAFSSPFLRAGSDYRLIDKPGTINPVPTIEILASPASNAFWQLQAEALDGKVSLRSVRYPATDPATPNGLWEGAKILGLGIVGIVAGAFVALSEAAKVNTQKWHVYGDGPWGYAKLETYNESHWLDQLGIDACEGTLTEVNGTPIGKPCGHLEFSTMAAHGRIALPSGAKGEDYVFLPHSPAQHVLFDGTTGQYYLEAVSGVVSPGDVVDVYRRQDMLLHSPIVHAGFQNNTPSFVQAQDLSEFTRTVFERARKMEQPIDHGGKGLSEADALRWAARQLSHSWAYKESTWRRLGIMMDGAGSYQKMHQAGGIETTECETAATEFFNAAHAFGYNVRLVKGYMRSADCTTDKSQCHFTTNFLHAWVEYSDASGKIQVMESTPGMPSQDSEKDKLLDQMGGITSPTSGKGNDDFGRKNDIIMSQIRRLLFISDTTYNQGRLITLDRIQPILTAVSDPSLLGVLEPVHLSGLPPHYEEVILYPRDAVTALPTVTEYLTPHLRIALTAYEALENGDQILWSPNLGQYVLQTNAPGHPRRLRVYNLSGICASHETGKALPALCRAQEMTPEAPLPPNPADVSDPLRKIFADLAHYAHYPEAHIALRPAEVLQMAYRSWNKLLSVKNPDRKKYLQPAQKWVDTLLQGMPPDLLAVIEAESNGDSRDALEDVRNFQLQRLLTFFVAARAEGYPVELVVKSVFSMFNSYAVELQLRDDHGVSTIAMEVPLSGGNVQTESAEQRMAWMDHPDPKVYNFFVAMQDQQTATATKAFSGFADRVAAIPPMMIAVSTREDSWERQFMDNSNMTIQPKESHYTLPQQLQPVQSQSKALSGWKEISSSDKTRIFEFQGRRIVVDLGYSDELMPAHPKNAKGDIISFEGLSRAHFQRMEDPLREHGLDGHLYYSAELDFAVSATVMQRWVFKNEHGELFTFRWRFLADSNLNSLLPILRSDLLGQAVTEMGTYSTPEGTLNYHVLSPLLRRFLSDIRKDGGLRSPRTDDERMQVVTLYRQIIKMGLIGEMNNTKDAMRLAAMIYVMTEYQKLWKEYQGNFPPEWVGSHCVPVERDNIKTQDTLCVPEPVSTPEGSEHNEWLYQLAHAAELYKRVDVAHKEEVPVDIQQLLKDAAKWVAVEKSPPVVAPVPKAPAYNEGPPTF